MYVLGCFQLQAERPDSKKLNLYSRVMIYIIGSAISGGGSSGSITS